MINETELLICWNCWGEWYPEEAIDYYGCLFCPDCGFALDTPFWYYDDEEWYEEE